MLCLLPLLAGCARDPLESPVAWWHQLEGGPVAAQRPPPPGANLPYPKLGTTPARPALPDTVTRDRLREQLVAERERASRQAARAPIVVVAPTRGKAPAPPAPDATSATLAAADAPPPPPAPAPAPIKPSADAANAAALAAETPPTRPGYRSSLGGPGLPVPPISGNLVLAGTAAGDGADLPAIADAPPDPADFEGLPAFPTAGPAAPVPDFVPTASRGTQLEFAPGSDLLLNASRGPLHALIARRGKATILVTGNGDAASDQPEAQQVALDLGLRRARSVAVELATLGVPEASVRIEAAAFGRGAQARLLN